MRLAGIWLLVLGYALIYVGVEGFRGNSVTFVGALLGQQPQAFQQGQSSGPLGWLGGLFGFIWNTTPKIPGTGIPIPLSTPGQSTPSSTGGTGAYV